MISRRHHPLPPCILLPSAALLVAVMLLAGCAQTTTGASATPSVTLPAKSLSWQPVTPPPNYPYTNVEQDAQSEIAFASDGQTAYACDASHLHGPQIHLYVTHDRAATWTHTADLAAPAGTNACVLAPDANSPQIAVAVTTSAPTGAAPDPAHAVNFATTDGGATWHQLPASPPFFINALASYQSTIYAERTLTVGGGLAATLWKSTDSMRTWQPAGEGISDYLIGFWVNASTGALLAVSQYGGSAEHLWTSADGGQTWTTLTTPALDQIIIQAAGAGQPWQICTASFLTPPKATPTNTLSCGTDGGQTWANRPALNVTQTGDKGTTTLPASPIAIADDGAPLVSVLEGDNTVLYRLPAGSASWQSLGQLPNGTERPTDGFSFSVTYIPAPGGGMFWAIPNPPSAKNPMLTATYA